MPLSPRNFLQYSQVLDNFPLSVRNIIYAKSEYRDFKKGEYVFRDGDLGPYYMGGVMSGRLRVAVKSREGKELLITLIEKGELFGEMSMFDEMPRVVDVMADAPSTVMIIKREDFIPHMLTCHEAILSLFKITCRRMRMYVHTVELLALQNVKQKLGRHLLHLAQDYGDVENGVMVIDAQLSQSDIGLQLGVSRESVNKHINAFVEQGFLSYSNESIILRDAEGLKKFITTPDV